MLEGDVTAHHVEKKDAQGPNGGSDSLVPVILDPFGRAINASACARKKEIAKTYYYLQGKRKTCGWDAPRAAS